MGVKKLSELQLELLKVCFFNITNKNLLEVKKMFVEYFVNKLADKASYSHFKKNKTV